MVGSFYKNQRNNNLLIQEINNEMLVYTVGTFDLLHVGHIALLEQCRALGDVVAVGVASDSVVNSYKPNVPVIPLKERIEMLESLRCVDIVRPYYELEYVSACKELDVDIFVIGEDWGSKAHNTDVESYLKAKGKKVTQVIYNMRTSSSAIKQNVLDQNLKKPSVVLKPFPDLSSHVLTPEV